MGDLWALLLTVLLLLANAFFVAVEFALIASRRDRLESLIAQGRRRARVVLDATEHLSMMLAASQLGITIASIVLGKVGEPAIAHLLEAPLRPFDIPSEVLHSISFVVALSLVSVLHILLGEMVPKNVALAGPESTAMILVPVQMVFLKIARPLIHFYNFAANAVLRLVGIQPREELASAVSPRELAAMIGESRSEGLIDAPEHARLVKALRTSNRTVGDVMIPLAKIRGIVAGAQGTTVGAIESAVVETGFSRFPVRTAGGDFLGFLHVKDVLEEVLDATKGPETRVPLDEVRPLPRITVSARLDDALTLLRGERSHLGLVVGADDGTPVGIVALEDVMEEFVGTVRDNTHRSRP